VRKNYRPRPRFKRSSPRGKSEHGLSHKPVLLKEVIEKLAIKEDGVYVDATFGRGGHTKEILRCLGPKGRVYALDKDPEAIAAAKLIKDKRFKIRQGSFTKILEWMQELNLVGKVNGILLDLGVSSPQLEKPERGFSFLSEGPLDMRMDPSQGEDAASWINRASYEEIDNVLNTYGQERFHERIAKAIVHERGINPIKTTKQLSEVVSKANPKWEAHKHPATRTFQAIRIFINNELHELENCLRQGLEVLGIGGRLLVIDFHSLEDRIVKEFIYKQISGGIPHDIPVTKDKIIVRIKPLGGAIKPTDEEIAENPRARSAKLRVMEKIS
jgi:16S rRNA (cytosine1402-N4)-methyltransferase